MVTSVDLVNHPAHASGWLPVGPSNEHDNDNEGLPGSAPGAGTAAPLKPTQARPPTSPPPADTPGSAHRTRRGALLAFDWMKVHSWPTNGGVRRC